MLMTDMMEPNSSILEVGESSSTLEQTQQNHPVWLAMEIINKE